MPSLATESLTLNLSLTAETESPRRLRRALQEHGLDADLDHTVTLLASELVANSIRHAGEGDIQVAATLAPGFARVEVLDSGPGFDPDVRHDADGFGLRLVDKLATRWGVERGRATVVWFEVDRRRRRFTRDEA
jgi:anti-sigma regulatory factor (Ser/Thr protein kinase)